MNAAARLAPALLLVEPDSLMRRTVAGVASELGLARLREASTYEMGHRMLLETRYHGVIAAIDDEHEGFRLVELMRSGATASDPLTPVAVLTAQCNGERAARLRALGVRRVVLKPFKVRTVLEVVTDMAAGASPEPPGAGRRLNSTA